MAKKDFTKINTAPVYDVIAAATGEAPEAQDRPRINLALDPEQYDYIKTMARLQGQTMTGFINGIIAQHAADHAEIYTKAKELIKGL